MKRSIFISALLLFPLFTHAQQKGVSPVHDGTPTASGTTRALVIGVSHYQDSTIPSLKYAHIDAEEFVAFLKSKSGGTLNAKQIEIITNEQATAANIYAKLDWLLEVTGENDLAIIYFSGHGDVETATSRNRGFLLAYDTPPTNYRIGALRVNDLNDILADLVEVNRARVVLVTDACRSGKLAGGTDGANATASSLAEQYENQIKIMSCQPDEFSLEGEQWGGGRGVFSYHLIDGLTGMADVNNNAEVNLYELEKYLKDKIPEETDLQQVPILKGPPKTILSNIDAAELAALLEIRNSQEHTLTAVRSKGMEDKILAKTDTIIQQLYDEFMAALDDQYFLPEDINQNREPGKSASELYDILSKVEELLPMHSNIKRNFAVALQDKSQQSINAYLKADPEEMNERWINFGAKYKSNPAYLSKAASLLGESHYLHDRLISKKYYYEGLLLRLEGEKTESDSLFNLALKKEKLALQYDDEAAFIYNEMGMIYKDLYYAKGGTNDKKEITDSLYNKQILMFEKANQLTPKWVMPYVNLAGLYLVNNELEKSENACSTALSLDSNQLSIKWYMGDIHFYKNEYKKAIKLYNQVIDKKPDFNAIIYNDLGHAYFKTDQLELAEKMYFKGLELDSIKLIIYKNLGFLYYMSKNYDRSMDINLKWSALDKENSMPYFNIACVVSLQGKGEEAVNWLEKAIIKGFINYDWIKNDTDLNNARNAASYLKLKNQYFPDN